MATPSQQSSCGVCRTANGGACIRNIKAPLPNIDRSLGSASLAVALAIGIALSSLGGIFLCISIIILYKWRKVCSTLSLGSSVSHALMASTDALSALWSSLCVGYQYIWCHSIASTKSYLHFSSVWVQCLSLANYRMLLSCPVLPLFSLYPSPTPPPLLPRPFPEMCMSWNRACKAAL